MSCKSRGKESEIESVQSHQETSDLIEKGIKYFSRTRTGKRPAIYFKIAACGTGSKKNLKVIYRQIQPLHLGPAQALSSNRDVSLQRLDSHYNYAYRDRRSEKT